MDSLTAEGNWWQLSLILSSDLDDIECVFSKIRPETDKRALKRILRGLGANAIENWFFGGSSSSRAVNLLGPVLQSASEQVGKRIAVFNRAWYTHISAMRSTNVLILPETLMTLTYRPPRQRCTGNTRLQRRGVASPKPRKRQQISLKTSVKAWRKLPDKTNWLRGHQAPHQRKKWPVQGSHEDLRKGG